MKLLFKTVLTSILIFTVMVIAVPVKTGNLVYQVMASLESTIYGLDEAQVDLDEMKMSIFQNNNSSRPTILMIHGFSADKVNWIRFAKHFESDFNLIIPDMAGHGETGFKKSWDYSPAAQSQLLSKLLDILKIEKVHIIGNSMGGLIAAQFTKNFPEKTLSLAMIDPIGVKEPIASEKSRQIQKGKNPFIIYSKEDFDNFYPMTMANPPWIPDFVLESIAEKYIQRRPELQQIFNDIHDKDLSHTELDQIQAKTLLIWGEKDRLVDVSSVKVWQQNLNNIEVKIYPNIGHMAMLEIPNQSAKDYLTFLEKIQ